MAEQKKRLSEEQVTAMLKTGAKKRRPKRLTMFVVLFVLFILPLALLTWWFWPRPTPPRLIVIAFDHFAAPGQNLTIRTQLESPPDAEGEVRLTNWPVYFQEQRLLPIAGKSAWEAKGETDNKGIVTAKWKLPEIVAPLTYVARYAPPDDRLDVHAEDRGQVFFVAPVTPLLVVDVENSLTDGKVNNWNKKNILDIPFKTEAFVALAAAAQRKKMLVVYLACGVGSGSDYRKVRGWIQGIQLPNGQLAPAGPVLARSSYLDNGAPPVHMKQRIKALREEFKNPIYFVTSDHQSAKELNELATKTIYVSDDPLPPMNVITIKQWDQLAGELD